MTFPWQDSLYWFSPLWILAGAVLMMLSLSTFISRDRAVTVSRWIASLALAVAFLKYLHHWQFNADIAVAHLALARTTLFASLLVLFSSLCVSLSSTAFLRTHPSLKKPELYMLLVLGTLGLLMMLSSGHLLFVFLGLEMASLSFYISIGMRTEDRLAHEASLKYYLLGALGSAFFLYGIAYFYAATSSLSLVSLEGGASLSVTGLRYLQVSFVLLAAGMVFKAALFPFYFWTLDVYQGAPTLLTGWMSTVVKATILTVLLMSVRKFSQWIGNLDLLFSGIAAASLILGGLLAVGQSYVKRLLACSSISHAATALIAIAAGCHGASWDNAATGPMLYYLLTYTVMTLGAFLVLGLLTSERSDDLPLSYLRGLAKKRPQLAFYLSLFTLSLAGLPPTAGFFAKYTVFIYAIEKGLTWLVALALATTLIGLYYYLKLIALMYFEDPDTTVTYPTNTETTLAMFIIAFLGIATLALGIMPQQYLHWALSSQ